MRAPSLVAAAAIVLLANTFALVHVARNGAGSPDAELTLTQRELIFPFRDESDDNSGVNLTLAWTGPGWYSIQTADGNWGKWFDRTRICGLGFDCRMPPDAPGAFRFYQRQRPRTAFVALEYDGPSWRMWLDSADRAEKARGMRVQTDFTGHSHLFAIDADLSADRLRNRYPDRSKVIIVSAVVAIDVDNYTYSGERINRGVKPSIIGGIRQIPSSVQIPRPFSISLPRKARNLNYHVRVRYGALHEPIVMAAEVDK
jgi:hypothetical protein